MRLKRRLLTLAAALFLIALMDCSHAEKAGPFNFLDNFSSGSIVPNNVVLTSTPDGKLVFLLPAFEVAGDKRRAIIVMADAKITFSFSNLGQQPKLTFSVGMNSTIGDGADGIITVEADGKSEEVYRKYIDPIDRPEDRKWFDGSVDLSNYAGKKVKISFSTDRGPKVDAMADWFAWSNLELK